MIGLTRRSFVGGLACAGGLAVSGIGRAAAAPALAAAYPQIVRFDVTRNGSPLGVVMVRFDRGGGETVTDVYIDFVAGFAGIPLYRYEHRARERWRDGRLVALDSVTNDDGTRHGVTARAVEGGLLVEGGPERLVAPADIVPSSYWHPRFVEQRRMLDSQRGRLLDFTIDPVGPETVAALGRSVDTVRYAMRGDLELDLWYDADRVWQKLAFSIRGSFIDYTRVEPASGDPGRFGTPLRDGRTLPVAA